MAQVRIANKAHFDPRFDMLAEVLGMGSRWQALGCMVPIWNMCTEVNSSIFPVNPLGGYFGNPTPIKVGDALVSCGLADWVDADKTNLTLRGFEEYCTWLSKARDGGKRGEVHGKNGGRPKTPLGVAGDNPLGGYDNKPPGNNNNSNSNSKNKRGSGGKKPAAKPKGEHQEFIAEFDRLFAEANAGAKPTWNGTQCKRVKNLLSQHGLGECIRRAGVMFSAPPPWPPPPHDLATLEQHFDKFATPFVERRRANPEGSDTERIGPYEGYPYANELKPLVID
jgi:hypothetical protein